jgi:hypothetical protein
MQEITPREAAQSRPFPTSAIIKEAWHLSTTYFWPLTMAIFVIGIPATIILANVEDPRRVFQFNNFYDLFVSGFVMVGAYRTIYLLKSEGRAPTFGAVYGEGNPYYGLNFRASFLIGLYFLGIGIVMTLLVLPCWIAINNQGATVWSYLLFSLSLIASISLFTWFGIRCMLYRAAIADNASGAQKTVEHSLALTRNKVGSLIPLTLVLAGGFLAWFMLVMGAFFAYGVAYEADMPKGTEVMTMILLDIPLAFWEAFVVATLALTYLHLKETSKPAAHSEPAVPAPEKPVSLSDQ